MVVMQVPVPEHPPPDQPPKVEPTGVALRVTTVPVLYEAEQVVPQLIPDPVTVPEPFLLIVSTGRAAIALTASFEYVLSTSSVL
jgi:hypothetical protein